MVNEFVTLHPVRGKKTLLRERYFRWHKLRFHVEIHVNLERWALRKILLQTKQQYKQHRIERFYLKYPDCFKGLFPFPNSRKPGEHFINLINDKYETSVCVSSFQLFPVIDEYKKLCLCPLALR